MQFIDVDLDSREHLIFTSDICKTPLKAEHQGEESSMNQRG